MNTYPICDSPLQRSARRSFVPSKKSRRDNRSCVWKEVLSNMIFVAAQKLSSMVWAPFRPVSNVVLLPCRTQLIELNSTLARQKRDVWNVTKSYNCRVARQALLCYMAVARLGFKRPATAMPNSIDQIKFDFSTPEARRPFLYFRVSFSATPVLFDWIKFDVWNQVVLMSCCSRATVEPA